MFSFKLNKFVWDDLQKRLHCELEEIDRLQHEFVQTKAVLNKSIGKLKQIGIIPDTNSNNSIDISTPYSNLSKLYFMQTSRSEKELGSAMKVYKDIRSNYSRYELKVDFITQLHKELYSRYPIVAGKFKQDKNPMRNIIGDRMVGKTVETVSPENVGYYLEELNEEFEKWFCNTEYHHLLLIIAYFNDFLMIHPFIDGNGRTSRVILTWLLLRAGYEVVRYYPLEDAIDRNRQGHTRNLEKSHDGWFEIKHDMFPLACFFLKALKQTYLSAHSSALRLAEFTEQFERIDNILKAFNNNITIDQILSSDSKIKREMAKLFLAQVDRQLKKNKKSTPEFC